MNPIVLGFAVQCPCEVYVFPVKHLCPANLRAASRPRPVLGGVSNAMGMQTAPMLGEGFTATPQAGHTVGTDKVSNVLAMTTDSVLGTDHREAPHAQVQTLMLEVVVPVYNEQVGLGPSVHRLHKYLSEQLRYPFRITIADNASTDDTLAIAEDLAALFAEVRVVHLPSKGRGGALKAVWGASEAEVLAYMDVDLSTDLRALLPLVAPLISGHSDVAIGTRLARGSRVTRGPKREFVSRSYNLLLRGTLGARFSDAQCGFKAIRADAAAQLLPMIEDTGWFFDTELLVLTQRADLRIHEVPVDWVDDPDSRVDIVATAAADVRGIMRLGSSLMRGKLPLSHVRTALGRDTSGDVPTGVSPGLVRQVVRFGMIGIASTVAYLVLFMMLSSVVGAQLANFAALLITAVGNTAANRRLTFGVTGRSRRTRQHGQGLLVFGFALAITSGSLAVLHATGNQSLAVEVVVLVVANLGATLFRFIALKHWVFGRRPAFPQQRQEAALAASQGASLPG